jgi:hypothetical protein
MEAVLLGEEHLDVVTSEHHNRGAIHYVRRDRLLRILRPLLGARRVVEEEPPDTLMSAS